MDYIYLPVIIFTLIILFYVTFQDIKYREINIVSLIALSIVSLIYLALFIFKKDFSLWYGYFIQLGVTFVFLLIFYILGKISDFIYIGEGDLYTIMALSFTNIFNIYFPMFVFFFALLLTLLIPVFIFFYNLLSKNFPRHSFFDSIYLMFLGYPLKINQITKFYTPLERFYLEKDKVKSKIIYKPIIEPEKEILSLTKFSKNNNILKIWVSPLVPFIILILLSYILVMFFYVSNLITFVFNLFI